MTTLILRTTTSFLLPVLMLFSVFLLLRGHNEPGGGFSGGLVAASAYALYALAYDVAAARAALGADPRTLIGAGLLLALGSGLLPLLAGLPLLTGLWGKVAGIDFGSPVLFDAGVYLVVVGVVLTMILALAEE